MKSSKTLATVIVCLLTACVTPSTKPSQAQRDALIAVSCPELRPLAGSTFGALAAKLAEVSGQYRECRAAALGVDDAGVLLGVMPSEGEVHEP